MHANLTKALIPALLLSLAGGIFCQAQPSQHTAGTPVVRYHFGDDPEGKLGWAKPDFDDSAWPETQIGKWPLPSNFSNGFLWERAHMTVRSDAAEPLAIRVASATDPVANETFVNGRLVGRLGSLAPRERFAQEAIFELPSGLTAPGATAVVALRFRYPPVAHEPFAVVAGEVTTRIELDGMRHLQPSLRADREAAVIAEGPAVALNIVILFLGGGLLLFWFRFGGRELLLCSGLLIGQTVYMLEIHLFAVGFLPIPWRAHALFEVACNVVTMYLIIQFLWAVYGVRYTFLKAAAMASLVGFNAPNAALILASSYSRFTSFLLLSLNVSLVVFNLVQGGVSLWMLFVRRQRQAMAAALVLIPITAILLGVGSFSSTTIGPISLNFFEVAFFVSEIALFTMLSHRAWREWRAREELRSEFDAAREVQERLVPPALDIPGFAVQSAYRPARDVGGDFFFVRAGHNGAYQDNRNLAGGAFVVVGDVSGKGLRAALTVSAIMGALRTMPDLEPSRILVALNRGLIGQLGGGFVTCLAITISADGVAAIANAGHLQPYCNGREITLDSGLPLGILPSAEFTETRVRLAPADCLTLITDGVLEARNSASGELFGFDRAAAISKESAENVARVAQAFGQEDDITVLTLTRLAEHDISVSRVPGSTSVLAHSTEP